MSTMNDQRNHPPVLPASSPVVAAVSSVALWGIVNGLAATFGYALASAFLRQAADDPPIWVSTIKAACTAAIFAPWLLLIALRGNRVLPPPGIIAMLVAVSVIVQVFGNVAYQLALAHIGLALAVPLTLGAMVLSSAILGRVLMSEPLTYRIVFGLGVLIVAIAVLSMGAKQATTESATSAAATPLAWLWGAVESVVSGFAYALLGLAVRKSTQHQIPLATPIVFVSAVGTIILAALSLTFEGIPRIQAIAATSWWAMVAAGLLNGISFLALAKSLKLLPVVYVNAINTLQMLATAFIGLYWFREEWTSPLGWGLVLMIGGLGFLAYAAQHHRQRARPSAQKTLRGTDD
jgi:drug/metabolite transporter (DMT)-like permease